MRELRPIETLASIVNTKVVANKDPALPYVGLEHIGSGTGSLVGSGSSTSSVSTNGVFRRGDSLFGKLRPNLRKSALAAFDGYCSTDILILRANEGTSPSYLAKLLQSEGLAGHAVRTSMGTKMPRTSWSAMREYLVFGPSLGEQWRIAEILDTLDEAIQKTEQLIAKLKQMKQGLLHDLLTRGIDENGELRDPERHPELFNRTALGLLPRDWSVSSVDAEFELSAGLTLGPHRTAKDWGWPYLRVANVHRDRLELADVATLRASADERVTKALRTGDLLVVEGHANPAEIGRCAMVIPDAEGFGFQNHLFRLRTKRRLIPEFGLRWLNSEWSQHYWQGMCATSSGLNTINQSMLAALRVAVPSLGEQTRMVSAVDSASTRIRADEATIRKLRLLKAGLMEDLLTGRVRVTNLLNETP